MRNGRVLIVGDLNAGKTELANALSDKEFSNEYSPTLGIVVNTNKETELDIASGPGDPERMPFVAVMAKHQDLVILAVDLSSSESIKYLNAFVSNLNKLNIQVPLKLVSTKSDLEQKVDQKEVESLCKAFNINIKEDYHVTSASTHAGIQELFTNLQENKALNAAQAFMLAVDADIKKEIKIEKKELGVIKSAILEEASKVVNKNRIPLSEAQEISKGQLFLNELDFVIKSAKAHVKGLSIGIKQKYAQPDDEKDHSDTFAYYKKEVNKHKEDASNKKEQDKDSESTSSIESPKFHGK